MSAPMTAPMPSQRRLAVFSPLAEDGRLSLADHLPEELPELLAARGVRLDLTQARRLYASAIQRGEGVDGTKGLALQTKRALAGVVSVPGVRVVQRRASPTDGFVKYLLALDDGREVEAVRIPIPCEPPSTLEGEALRARVQGEWRGRKRKYVVCVSSQVGCALGCSFCATATLGFTRNLRPSEIIAQLLAIRAEADRPVRGVVFMGMGEPFLNYDAVLKAAQIASHPCGLAIAAGDITISTAGIVPYIRRFTAEGHKFRLAVSFTSARPDRRRELMPIEKKYPTEELVEAIREHAEATGERVTVAYVAIGGPGGNCTDEDARALGERFRGVPIRLDLIDVNGEVGAHPPPSEAELSRFRGLLDEHLRQPVVRRYSGGKDVDAACGMLAARTGN
jgi:23S rRNA (adenine2503-C2)-methyltransferase